MRNIVLGLHKDPWHNAGAACVGQTEDGARALAAVCQERLDRQKNSRAFPEAAAMACLAELGVRSPNRADLVAYDYIYRDDDWRKDYRRNPCRRDVLLGDIDPSKLLPVRHHLCHAASCFFTSPFEDAAILVVDGRGTRWETQTLWSADGNHIELVDESYCVGIGLIYEAMTQALGFGFLEAGKTMGLSPFGRDDPGPMLEVSGKFDGMSTDYSAFCNEDSQLLFKPPDMTRERVWRRSAFDIQSECERAMLHLTEYAHQKTGKSRLCLTGGVALNGVANERIRRSGLFDQLYINPACSDTGIALGAALWGYHAVLGAAVDRNAVSPFVGPRYDQSRFDAACEAWRGPVVSGDVEAAATALLVHDRVVAHFDGRSEMGPRALGNRSILMSPLRARNRDYLNDVVKRREPFRPFAPCVPVELASTYFDLEIESAFMLLVAPVREEWRARLPAVTHVDGTARVQTVDSEFHPRLHRLLSAFGAETGVFVLLNTSFNVAGEPLVESPENAVESFRAAPIDALLIGNRLLLKEAM